MRCPYCDKEYPEKERFCEICGTPLEMWEARRLQRHPENDPSSLLVECSHCGKMHPVHIHYCPYTGDQFVAAAARLSKKGTPRSRRVKLVFSGNDEIWITKAMTVLGRRDFFRVAPADNLPYISRQHFVISFDGGEYYIEDKGSKNGTWLNGEYITGQGKQRLKDGDIIDIGNVVTATFKIF